MTKDNIFPMLTKLKSAAKIDRGISSHNVLVKNGDIKIILICSQTYDVIRHMVKVGLFVVYSYLYSKNNVVVEWNFLSYSLFICVEHECNLHHSVFLCTSPGCDKFVYTFLASNALICVLPEIRK